MKANSLILTGIALVLGAASASAQNGTFRATEPARSGSSRGVERRPAPPPPPQPTYYRRPAYYPPYYYYQQTYYGQGYAAIPAAYVVQPAILMSDGTVWANFGYGYEPVSRACVVNTSGQIMLANGVVIPAPPPSSYGAPQMGAYGLPIASQRTAEAQSACFGRDASGQFFVIR